MLPLKTTDDLWGYKTLLTVVCTAGTAAAAAGFYGVVILPLQSATAVIQQETEQSKEFSRQAARISKTQDQLAADLAAARRRAEELALQVPATPAESDFLSQVCRLAEETGLEVTDYQPGGIETLAKYQEMEVKFSARGEYAALARFMSRFPEIPRRSRLTHFRVVTPEADQLLTIELIVKIYFAPAKVAAAAPK